jgi:outer membrane protein TolC
VRVGTAALVALAVLLVDVPSAHASQADLDRARRKANAAASDVFRAETRLSNVQSQLAALEAKQQATKARLSALQGATREAAVARYMRGTDRPVPFELDPTDASSRVRAEALAEIVAAGTWLTREPCRADERQDGRDGAVKCRSRRSASA